MIMVIVAIAVGVVGWMFVKIMCLPVLEAGTRQFASGVQTQLTDGTENWKAYKVSDMGFRFKAPADWNVISLDVRSSYPSGGYTVGIDSKNALEVESYDSSGETVDTLMSHCRESGSATCINPRIVSIDGVQGVREESYVQDVQDRKTIIYSDSIDILRGGKRLEIAYRHTGQQGIFDKLLENFKFVDVSDISKDAIFEGFEPTVPMHTGSDNKELFIGDLRFMLPDGWVVAKFENGTPYIKDLSYKSKYEVFLFPQAYIKSEITADNTRHMTDPIRIPGGELFDEGFASYDVLLNSYGYHIVWGIKGNEPMPAGNDGPWTPSNSFANDRKLELMKTVVLVMK